MRTPLSVLLAAILLAGCSSGGQDAAADLSSASAGGGVADTGDAAAGAGQAGGLVELRVGPGEAVVRTAELAVRVQDVRQAADAAQQIARAAGGRVEAEDRSGSGDGGTATVQLRVPPAAFDEAIRDLVALGDERSRRLATEDVGEQVADLDARLATQQASVERVRALLAEADALGEVVQIEAELTKRTADLEALQARLAALEARVDLATIVLHLDGAGGPVIGDALGFGDGLSAGWDALSTAARAAAVAAGALLPFLPLLLLAGWLVGRARWRRTAAAQP